MGRNTAELYKKFACCIVGIILLAGTVYSQTTYRFVVKKKDLDPEVFIGAGKNDKKQGLWNTRILDIGSTKYALVQFTPDNVVEENEIEARKQLKHIDIIWEDVIIHSMSRGRLTIERSSSKVGELPKDFYEVKKSS